MNKELQQHLETLEIHQAYLEQNMERLEQYVAHQHKQLDTLKRQVRQLLAQKAHAEDDDSGISPFDPNKEIPPHY